jgi:transcriptional regulator with XRE-family HTH domain
MSSETMKSSQSTIADNLKKLLFEQDLTPTELARNIDIPQQTIQRIVKSKIKKPHTKTLKAIADFFKIDVNELTGQVDSLFFNKPEKTNKHPEGMAIPVYAWDQLDSLEKLHAATPAQRIFTLPTYHDHTFGVMMNDSSMNPYFPKDSILVIEPSTNTEDRSFILVYLNKAKKFLFRQLLTDGENMFLKALSSDLAMFPVRKLDKDDTIMGIVVETRQTHFKTLSIK